jgi:hypothetical protein
VELFIVPIDGGAPSGPYPTALREGRDQPRGLYVTRIDLPEAGVFSFVSVTDDGRAGAETVQVTDPHDGAVPGPGRQAISVATPTASAPLGVAAVCTQDPPCGMHEVSLDDALARRRPIALTFATPAYCMTAVCGPSVAVLDEVRRTGEFGDVVFIHVEVYADAGQTVAEAVRAWELPSEPWLFAIDRDGRVVDRVDGPLLTLPEHVAAMVARVR